MRFEKKKGFGAERVSNDELICDCHKFISSIMRRCIKSWLKKKYTAPFRYYGELEHYLVVQTVNRYFFETNKKIELSPTFDEYLNGKKDCTVVNPPDATFAQMNYYFENQLGEIIERLGVGFVLGLNTVSTQTVIAEAEEKSKSFADDIKEYFRLSELETQATDLEKKADREKVQLTNL